MIFSLILIFSSVRDVSAATAQCYVKIGTNTTSYRLEDCSSSKWGVLFTMSGSTPEDGKCYMAASGWGVAQTSDQGSEPCTTWAGSNQDTGSKPPTCQRYNGTDDEYNSMEADIAKISSITCDEFTRLLAESNQKVELGPGMCYLLVNSTIQEGNFVPIIDTCWGILSHFVTQQQTANNPEPGTNIRPGGGGESLDVSTLPKPSADTDTVSKVIGIVLNISGAIAVLMVTIAGFKYVMSMGHPDATKKAKDTILYALIGLAVVLFAKVIVGFVFNNI